jgi:hypothetical protein
MLDRSARSPIAAAAPDGEPYFGRFDLADFRLDHSPLGLWAVFIPVVGGLIVGLDARQDEAEGRGEAKKDFSRIRPIFAN